MRVVGIRELKNRLSEHIRRVRAGDEVLVTDRGEVVAELRPPGRVPAGTKIGAGFAALAKEGLLRLGVPNEAGAYPPLPRLLSSISVKDLLGAERGPH